VRDRVLVTTQVPMAKKSQKTKEEHEHEKEKVQEPATQEKKN